LLALPDIGPRIAASVKEYFSDEDNIEIIKEAESSRDDLRGAVVRTASGNGPLAGKTVVVSGTFEGFTRDGIKAAIEAAGGKKRAL
jgi:DNA ligase (NAD+)